MSLDLDKSSWKRVTFGDVVANHNEYFSDVRDGVLPYVAGPHIDPGVISISKYGSTGDDDFPPTFKRMFAPGDVLLHSRGIEKIGVVDRHGVTGEKLFVLRSKDRQVVDQRYLPWLLASDSSRTYFRNHFSGSVNKFLNWRPLAAMEFDLPPLDEQQRIADLLWAVERHRRTLAGLIRVQAASNRAAFSALLDSIATEDRRLGELGRFARGRRFTKADYVSEGLGCIHYAQIHTDFGVSAAAPITHVPESMRPSLRLAHPGDLVIAGTSEDVDGVGKAVAWVGDDDVAVHDDCFVFSHNLDPIFASYLFASLEFDQRKRQFVSESKVVRLSQSSLARIALPIPDLASQRRVVGVMVELARLVEITNRELSCAEALQRALVTSVFGSG